MTTRQTPDAVREAVAQLQEALKQAEGHESQSVMVKCADLRAILAALDSRAGDAGEAVAWCSPGQLANLTDVDRDGGVYLPIRKTRRGNFTMPLFATPAPAVDAVPAGEVERKAIRDEIINTPETADFMAGVPLEAAHQRDRWGADHDAGKMPLDWFWLIGFLAQKAADAAMRGDIKKAKHHTISTGAALANWHAALTGADIKMRPGISAEAQAAAEGRGALSLALQTDALSHGEGR